MRLTQRLSHPGWTVAAAVGVTMVLHFITTRQKPTLKAVQSTLTFQQET